MEKPLFISPKEVKEFTSMNGNVDNDYVVPQILASQDTNIESILGSVLFDKLKADISAQNVPEPYLTLLNEYVKPCLAWFTFSSLLYYQAYQFANTGIFKHQSENSITPELNELDAIRSKAESVAQKYSDRTKRYLCANSSLFPEYNQYKDGGISPNTNQPYFGGMNLD